MKDSNKTREQLLKEMAELQKRVAATEKINKDLLESEAKYRNITENAALGIIAYNETGQCIATNKAMAKMVGATTVEQLLSQNFNKIESWKKSGLLDAAKEALASGEKRKKSFHISTTFGKNIWLDAMFVTYNEKGEKFLLFLAEDITERKRVETELQSTNANLLALIESTNDATLISDRYALPVLWNKTYARIIKEALGIDMRKGLQPHTLLKDEKAVAWWDDLHRRVLSGESFREEYAHDFGKDDIRHFEISYNPIFENGKITGFSEFTRDITDRKKAENSLQESEEKYRGLFNAVFEGILIHEKGKIIEINPVFAEMFGYFPSELLGMNAFDTIAPECRESVRDKIKSGFEGYYESAGLRKDGSKFDIEIQAKEINYKGRKVRVGTVRDISERKKAEKMLRDAHDLLEKRVKERTLELFESNAALKMLLKQREQDQNDFENNISSNVKHLVMPYIEKLKKHKIQQDELAYLNLIESNLKEIVSPFATRLSFQFLDFTPREIMIADLIKDGKHDKDIMEILNISLDTVKTHRKNIRRKLGIYGNRINLRTKLLTLTK
jgi:PAS domain S-box-containing protein